MSLSEVLNTLEKRRLPSVPRERSSSLRNMAPAIAYTLPAMQLVCNLVIPEGSGYSVPNSELAVHLPAQETSMSHRSMDFPENLGSSGTNTGPTGSHSTSGVLPEGYIAHSDIGVAYKIFNGTFAWKTAREQCIKNGARLAVTDTHIKFEHLMSQAPLNNAIHVGMHRMYDDAEWVSATTGSTIARPPFAPGYPNGVHDCVLAGYSPRGLRNGACASGANYACEIPIPVNYHVHANQTVNISAN